MTDTELLRLKTIERVLKSIFVYYTDFDIAAHFSAAINNNDAEGEVRKVWVNDKLVQTFRELRNTIGLPPDS